MNYLKSSVAGVLLALATSSAWGQAGPEATHDDYVRLLKATKYLESFKQTAAVSARVASARGQGSDPEYARFMNVVATADLSDAEGCLADVYATQSMEQEQAQTLIEFFESPLGGKFLEHSQRMFMADVERGSHEPLPTDTFSEAEKAQIAELQQDAAFVKYGQIVSNKDVWAGMMKCIMDAAAVKKVGIKQ